MLFDIRGRRRTVVKVVYAILAVLMGSSLFLVVGPLNIGEIFNSNSTGGGEAAKPFEEQAERLEAKLRKEPEDPDLLVALARAQVSAGNSQMSLEPTEEDLNEALQHYQQASATWSEYLEQVDKPSAGVAQLVAPALLTLAERARTFPEAQRNVEAAADTQRIVARQRPTINSLTTLALYTYFTGDFAAAEKAQAEAKKMAKEKFEREQIDKQLETGKKNAEFFQRNRKRAEKAEKAANKGNPESLQSPSSALNGAFGGGSGLGE